MCGSCENVELIADVVGAGKLEYETDEQREEIRVGLKESLDLLNVSEVIATVGILQRGGVEVPAPIVSSDLEEIETFAREALLGLAVDYPEAYALAAFQSVIDVEATGYEFTVNDWAGNPDAQPVDDTAEILALLAELFGNDVEILALG